MSRPTPLIEALTLCRYPSKAEVARINDARLEAIKAREYLFDADDYPGTNSRGYPKTKEEATSLLDRHTIWPNEITLKEGAFVMLVTVSFFPVAHE